MTFRRITGILLLLAVAAVSHGQTTQKLIVHPLQEPQQVQTLIADSLFGGGGVISNIEYNIEDNLDGIGSFEYGGPTVGFNKGIVLSNGYVKTLEGSNTNGAALNERDKLGDRIDDYDLNRMLTELTGSSKGDTVHDASVITFKFKPFFDALKIEYCIGSEEYLFHPGNKPDVNMTDSAGYDVSAIFYNTNPGNLEYMSLFFDQGGPTPKPVTLGYINDHKNAAKYVGNTLLHPLWTQLDGLTQTFEIFQWVTPCEEIYFKIGVADNYIYMENPETGQPIGEYMNSAIFLKANSLRSVMQNGMVPEWAVDGESDNLDFEIDELVEGGCSNLIVTLERNIQGYYEDTVYIGFKIQGASTDEYTLTPEPFNDSTLIILPESEIYTYIVTAIDDGIDETQSGPELWKFRYQLNPCDLPGLGGFGTGYEGYSGIIPVKVHDYEPITEGNKSYGPTPQSIYTCGNDVTVSVTDITTGGLLPLNYLWSHPASGTIGNGVEFTFPLSDSPDLARCVVSDRCTGFDQYDVARDTVTVYSSLTAVESPDFQLCENLDWEIEITSTNVGEDFEVTWSFQGNPVGTGHSYLVTWAEYGIYYGVLDSLVFEYVVTDDCGNTTEGTVVAFWDPIVQITGSPVVCRGDIVTYHCTPGQSYTWTLDGNNVGGNEMTVDIDTEPLAPGMHQLCIEIINACDEPASECFQFEVSELTCEVTLNGTTDFSICPLTEFSLQELNATSDWYWSWFDDGTTHHATGQVVSISLKDAGAHDITVSAYNDDGCFDEEIFEVNVHPYTNLMAISEYDSVCVGTSTVLSTEYDIEPVSYYWEADPPDNSLSGQESSPNPEVFPGEATLYTCYAEDINGCLDTAEVSVDTRPPITGSILAANLPACEGEPVTIDFSTLSPLVNVDFQWNFQGGTPTVSTEKSVDVTWGDSGLKSITLEVTEPGCEFTMNYTLNVNVMPQPAAMAENPDGCVPHEVTFRDQSTQTASPTYLWDFGDGSTSQMKDPVHLYETAGTYDVSLTLRNGSGCAETGTFESLVEVYPQPRSGIDAEPQAATIDNPKISFFEQVDGYFSFIEWDFGDGTWSNDPNPVHLYENTGEYQVVQYIENEHGCWDSDTMRVFISEELKIFLPTAFSPNGDGMNDCFSVGGTTSDVVDNFMVKIFDRWGRILVRHTITSTDCLWDGRDGSGAVVQSGSYPYVIVGTDFTGKRHLFTGTVIVIL